MTLTTLKDEHFFHLQLELSGWIKFILEDGKGSKRKMKDWMVERTSPGSLGKLITYIFLIKSTTEKLLATTKGQKVSKVDASQHLRIH